MPLDLSTYDAQRILRAGLKSQDRAFREKASKVLQLHEMQRKKAGLKPFKETPDELSSRWENTKKVFAGLEGYRNPAINPNPVEPGDQEAQRRFAATSNIAYLAQTQGMDPIEVAERYPALRKDYATQVFGAEGDPGDEGLYGLIKGSIDKEAATIEAANAASDQAFVKYLASKPTDNWTSAYSEFRKENPNLFEGKDKAAERRVMQSFRQSWKQSHEAPHTHREIAKRIISQLQITKDAEGNKIQPGMSDDTVQRLIAAKPEDRELVYAILQSEAKDGVLETTAIEDFKTSMARGFSNMLGLKGDVSLGLYNDRIESIRTKLRRGGDLFVQSDESVSLKSVVANELGAGSLIRLDDEGKPIGRRKVKPSEVAELTKEVGMAGEYIKVMKEMREMDQRVLNPTTPSHFVTEKILYPATEQIGFMASALIPGAMHKGIAEQRATEMEARGVPRDKARIMGNISAAIEVPVEYLQLGNAAQGVKALKGIMSGAGVAKTLATNIIANVAVQNAQEALQDATNIMIQQVVSHVSSSVPTVKPEDWEAFRGGRADTFWALLPFAVIGGGGATYAHFKNGEALLRDRRSLVAAGVDFDTATDIAVTAIESPATAEKKLQDAYQEGKVGKPDPEAYNKAMEEMQAVQDGMTFNKDTGEVTLTDPSTGNAITFPDLDSALEGKIDIQQDNAAENLHAVRQVQALFEKRGQVEFSSDPKAFTTLQDKITAGMLTPEEARQRMQDLAMEDGHSKDYYDKVPFDQVPIDAESYFNELTGRFMVKMNEGGGVKAAIEDSAETIFKNWDLSGYRTIDQYREWIGQFQTINQEKFHLIPQAELANASPQAVIEAMSSLAVGYAYNKRADYQFDSTLARILHQLAELWKHATQRGALLISQFEAGVLDVDFETAVASAAGLDAPTRKRAARKARESYLFKAAKEMQYDVVAEMERLMDGKEEVAISQEDLLDAMNAILQATETKAPAKPKETKAEAATPGNKLEQLRQEVAANAPKNESGWSYISDIIDASEMDMEEVHKVLLDGAREGHVTLTVGDWSYASKEVQAGAIILSDEKLISARITTPDKSDPRRTTFSVSVEERAALLANHKEYLRLSGGEVDVDTEFGGEKAWEAALDKTAPKAITVVKMVDAAEEYDFFVSFLGDANQAAAFVEEEVGDNISEMRLDEFDENPSKSQAVGQAFEFISPKVRKGIQIDAVTVQSDGGSIIPGTAKVTKLAGETFSVSVPSKAQAEFLGRIAKASNSVEALQVVADTGSPGQRSLAALLSRAIPRDTKFEYVPSIPYTWPDGTQAPPKSILGLFAPSTNTISVATWTPPSVQMEAVLHEAIHAATQTTIFYGRQKASGLTKEQQAAVTKLEEIREAFVGLDMPDRMKAALDNKFSSGHTVDYIFNPTEFPAWVLVNEDFADRYKLVADGGLADAKVMEKLAAEGKITPTQKAMFDGYAKLRKRLGVGGQSLLDYVYDLVKRVLGIKADATMENAVEATVELLKVQADYLDDFYATYPGSTFSIGTKAEYAKEAAKIKPLPRKVSILRGVEIIRNPTPADYKALAKEERKDFPGTQDPETRHTQDKRGNTWIWRSSKGMHAPVEPTIAADEGVSVNQNNGIPTHAELVREALKAGEVLPAKVIAEYPHYAKFNEVNKSTFAIGRPDIDAILAKSQFVKDFSERTTRHVLKKLDDIDARWAAKEAKAAEEGKLIKDTEEVTQALRQLDALLYLVPPALRSKINGFVRLSQLRQDAAKARLLRKKIEAMEVVLKDHLKKKDIAKIAKAAKSAMPKKGKSSAGGPVAEFARKVHEILKLSADSVNERLSEVNEKIKNPPEDVPQSIIDDLEDTKILLQQYGGLNEASYEHVVEMLGQINEIIDMGKVERQLQESQRKAANEARRNDLLKSIGGPGSSTRARIKERERQRKKVRTFLRDNIDEHLSFRQDLERAFGGFVGPVIGLVNRVRSSTVRYTDRVIEEQEHFNEEMARIWGIKKKQVAKTINKLHTAVETDIFFDGQRQEIDQAEAINYTLIFNQTRYRANLEKIGYTADVNDQVEAFLSPEAIQLRAWLLKKYSTEHARLSEVYERLNGAKLPQEKNYAPVSFTPTNQEDVMIDPFNSNVKLDAVAAGFLRERVEHKEAPNRVSALAAYWAHTTKAEYYIAWAETVQFLRDTLGHKDTRLAIKSTSGQGLAKVMDKWISVFANNGNNKGNAFLMSAAMIRKLKRAQAFAGLSYNISSIMKQAPALVGFGASGLTARESIQSSINVALNSLVQGGKVQEAWQSGAIQRRLKSGHSVEHRMALEAHGLDPGWIENLMELGIKPLAYFDAMLTSYSAAVIKNALSKRPEFNRVKDDPALQAQLLRDAVTEAVNNTAQPIELMDRSLVEISNMDGWGAFLLMFRSEPRQKLALLLRAVEDLSKGKNKDANATTIFTVMVVMPAIMAAMTHQFRSIFRDPDDEEELTAEDYLMHMMAGPFSGIAYFGEAIDAVISGSFGENPFLRSENAAATGAYDLVAAINRGALDFTGEDFDVRKAAKVMARAFSGLYGVISPGPASAGVVSVRVAEYFGENPWVSYSNMVTEKGQATKEAKDKLAEELREEMTDLEYTIDRYTKVGDGTRATLIKKYLDRMETPDEREALRKRWIDMKLISANVQKQIDSLK